MLILKMLVIRCHLKSYCNMLLPT